MSEQFLCTVDPWVMHFLDNQSPMPNVITHVSDGLLSSPHGIIYTPLTVIINYYLSMPNTDTTEKLSKHFPKTMLLLWFFHIIHLSNGAIHLWYFGSNVNKKLIVWRVRQADKQWMEEKWHKLYLLVYQLSTHSLINPSREDVNGLL